MEEIITRACDKYFDITRAVIGTKIVIPISGGEKYAIALLSAGKLDSYALATQTVPFCAHLEWISNRIKIVMVKRFGNDVCSYLFN